MLTLRMIEAFRAVILNGSISEAAVFLHISQPAVSRLIKDLEAEIGFQLLERRQGRVFANDDALVLFEEVDRSYIGLDRISQAANRIRKRETGALNIACMPAIGLSLMPRVLASFQKIYPDIEINIQVVRSITVIQLLTSMQCDIGFVESTYSAPSIESGPVYTMDSVCILPPGHRLCETSIVTPADFEGEPFISLGSNDKTRFKIDAIFETADVNRQLKMEAPLMNIVCALVIEGCGVSIVDPMTAAMFAPRGLIIKPFQPSPPFSFRSLSSSRISGTSLVSDFYEIFSKEVKIKT